jgi:hypothetical protein
MASTKAPTIDKLLSIVVDLGIIDISFVETVDDLLQVLPVIFPTWPIISTHSVASKKQLDFISNIPASSVVKQPIIIFSQDSQ